MAAEPPVNIFFLCIFLHIQGYSGCCSKFNVNLFCRECGRCVADVCSFRYLWQRSFTLPRRLCGIEEGGCNYFGAGFRSYRGFAG